MTKKFYTYCKRVGNKVYVRGIKDGKRYLAKVDYSPSIFVETNKDSEFKTLNGENLLQITFGSISEYEQYKKQFADVHNKPLYGVIQPHYQYLHEKYPAVIDYDFESIAIAIIDIETTVEHGFPNWEDPVEEILLITMTDLNSGETWTFGRKPIDHIIDGVNYNSHESEEEMLNRFIAHWSKNYPDIISGWNVEEFDVPYLYHRMIRVCGEKAVNKLSPYGNIEIRFREFQGDKKVNVDIVGISTIDYLSLYKKFSFTPQENYKLDTVCFVELGENKLENPYDTFKEHYEKAWGSFVDYNIHDVGLVVRLEGKRGLLRLATSMAYTAKINYVDVFGPVNTWDVIIYNYLRYKNIIVPPRNESAGDDTIEGAYVKEPVPGMYEWVVSVDLNSLYPSIIMALNISPETLVDNRSDVREVSVDNLLSGDYSIALEGCALAGNGVSFDQSRSGFLAELMRSYYDGRKKEKRKMLEYESMLEQERSTASPDRIRELESLISTKDSLQSAVKLLLNSAYGATANKGFRFFDNRIAEAITKTGQLVIQTAEKNANTYIDGIIGNGKSDRIIASDTDSLYMCLNDVVQKFVPTKPKEDQATFLEKACADKIVPALNNKFNELAKNLNWSPDLLVFKLEVVAGRGVFVAKKRYALYVYSSEGVRYEKPKLKIKGLEIVRSSTPTKVREMLKKSVEYVLTSDESTLHGYVDNCEKQFYNLSPEEIAFPRGANNLKKYSSSTTIYKSGCPMQVRAALLYNHYVKELGLLTKYELIKEGEKIKFIHIKTPNRLHENVIAFNSKLPGELGLSNLVDYDLMFKKTYLEPLQGIIGPVGWTTKRQSTLDSLFE